jgi:hypothetical protein
MSDPVAERSTVKTEPRYLYSRNLVRCNRIFRNAQNSDKTVLFPVGYRNRAAAACQGFLGLAASMTILAALWPRSWACDDKVRI